MTEVITEVQEIVGKGDMIKTEEGILHSKAYPEVTIIQDIYTDKITIEIEVTLDRKGLEVNSSHQLEDLEWHYGLQLKTISPFY